MNVILDSANHGIDPIASSGQRKKQMLFQLQKLEEEYNASLIEPSSMPESLGLQKVDSVDVNMEDIAREATGVLAESKVEKEQQINESYLNKINDIEASKEKAMLSSNEELAKQKNIYDASEKNFVSNSIKQNIANSSIMTEGVSAIKEESKAVKDNVMGELKNTLNGIDADIEMKKSELSKALNEYELSYALKLESKINSLVAMREKTNADIAKHNNQIQEKETKYQADKSEYEENLAKENEANAKALAEYEERYGSYFGNKEVNYLKRYASAREYYNSLPRGEALKQLETDTMLRSYLGLYYDKLRYEIMGDR